MKIIIQNIIGIAGLTILVVSCSPNAHKSAPSGTLDYVGDQLITAPAPTGPFERPQSFATSKLLPASVLSGANFRVEPRFVNDGFLNTYIINSSYGKLKVTSTARLYKRIHEMNVINEIEKISKTKEFAKGVAEKGKDVVHGATSVVLHPVDTVTGAVTGVGKLFKRVGENVGGQARSDEESRLQDVIGYSKTKRDYANQLKVDVYTRNPLLQADLNSLAESGYAGNMLTALAISTFTGPVITATGTTNLLNKVVKDMAPADLRRMNREKLEKMEVLSTTADAFVKNGSYTPREQTVLVSALYEMRNTLGRDQFIKFATDADHYDVTYFRQLEAEMYADLNRKDVRIKQFINLGHFAAGVTKNNGIVVCFPLDYLMWTVDMAKVAATLTYKINALSWVTNKHMYLTGTLSPLARKNLTELGWDITDKTSALH